MTAYIFANNVNTTLAASAASSSTTLTLSSNVNLPSSIPAGSYFALTLNDAATRTVFEVVYATAVSGSNVTVLRGQEGTGAQNWSAGDYIYASDTAGILSSFAPVVGNPNQTYQVAPSTSATMAVPYEQMFQQITVTGTQTVSPGGSLQTVIIPSISANATITINAGTFEGQSVFVMGASPSYSVIIASSASSGSPLFIFPDSSTANSWDMTLGYGARFEMIWDGANWNVRTYGQTIGVAATAGNQYVTLTQANGAYAPAVNTYVTAAVLASYNYATESWVNDQGFATETWVNSQGFATETWVDSQGFATTSWVDSQGFATTTWVDDQHFATTTWVDSQGFATETWVDDQDYTTASYLSANFYPLNAYTNGTGTDTTITISVSLTAPCSGILVAMASMNQAGTYSGNGVSCELSINGTAVSSDSTTLSQSHFGSTSVNAGTQSATFVAGSVSAFDAHLLLVFIPQPGSAT